MANLATAQEQVIKSHADISKLNSIIRKSECDFALKLTSKCLLPQEVVNDIFSFCQGIHDQKMEFISAKLKKTFIDRNELKIDEVIETAELLNDVAGSGHSLLTHFKREKLLHSQYDFIKPEVKLQECCCK